MPEPFEPFKPVFQRYLVLLNLSGSATVHEVLGDLEQALRVADSAEPLRLMLEAPNWRLHLVAAAGALLLDDPSPALPALRATLSRGSWVSPQLVLCAWCLDPAFWSHAEARRIERFVRRDPEGRATPYTDTKALIATRLLARHDPEGQAWLTQVEGDAALQSLIEQERAQVERITARWHQRMGAALEAMGRPQVRLGPALTTLDAGT